MTGVVSAGHEKTAKAGQAILQAGGNAFDAAVAAVFAACVVEPTLTSLGGGGFLLAHQALGSASDSALGNASSAGENILFDFFTQTPISSKSRADLDFYPIEADFGDSVQEFHIGMGSIAVPGVLAGLLTVHKRLGRLPLKVVVEPAVEIARSGVVITTFQRYCYELLEPILRGTERSRAMFAPKGTLLEVGDRLQMREFADTLEYLAGLGDEAALKVFYEGEIAQQIVRDCAAGGGYLTLADLKEYEVVERSPLSINYRGVQMLTNPPPSAGGALIAFCLELLDRFDLSEIAHGSSEHLTLLSQAMRWTNEARREHLDGQLFESGIAQKFTASDLVDKYAGLLTEIMGSRLNRWGSTTHLSVIDSEGNAASVTTSNGEGSSYVVPGTQIMLNNMLGEEDLNPLGFNQWPENRRMSSMMAPTIILKDGKPQLALGSGGSNRIRTAILQVISNIVDFGMPLKQAVESPRIHWESGAFHLEPGYSRSAVEGAEAEFLGTDRVVHWQQANMFFGGVHSVGLDADGHLTGAGDPRRSGAVR